ncbi:hypothetical protein E8E13_000578 [Curvularia kusanoi]|uniref:Xylanolytic transcriptional activator regulatory domain-containing protein n=1 Tax=Curvularia kusanoi TaxID=90978 RepID=A0A9P4T432_CURKU|nr:hypothetical protein E8E13_000578 [Curvularia kusanoi]
MTQEGPAKPSLSEAKNLITFFFWVTTSFLDLFGEMDLMQPLGHWITAPTGCEQYREQDTMYFLIFAIAAQADPTSKESLADTYFAYGRYLVTCHFSEQPSITAVQSYMLIAMYLFAAARRDAAFMYTGLATRAAYALGLHRDGSEVSSPAEQRNVHQRLWKAVRVLDGYISTNLGRTPANNQSCGTTINDRYSSTLALCQIFQEILDQIYSKRRVSSNMLRKISDRQRQWTSRLREGLENDGIPFTEYIDTADHKELNLGLLFVKSGYYWSIILLSRPFLVDHASSVASTVESSSPATSPKSAETDIMVSACVDSAIHLIELFQRLANLDRLPKRLPFVVNTVHTASLILALSVFLDYDRKLRIGQYLERARSILVLFGAHDPLAKCNLAINESLQRCCDSYIKKRDQRSFRRQGNLVAQYFGSLKEPETLDIGTSSCLLPQDESLSSVDLFDSDFNFLEPMDSASFLTDDSHPSLGNHGLEFTTSAIQSDFYDFIFPPDYTLFGSIDGGLRPLTSLDASFTDGI